MAPKLLPSSSTNGEQRNYTVNIGDTTVSGKGVSNSIGVINNYYGAHPREAGSSPPSGGRAKDKAATVYTPDPLSWDSTLSRISDYNSRREQGRIARQRVKGTAEWITKAPAIQDWMAKETGSILWFTGKIGSGKSVACAYFVEYLKSLRYLEGYSIIFHFIASSRQGAQEESYFLRSLLKQILTSLEQHELCSPEIKAEIDRFFRPTSENMLDIDDLKDMICRLYQLLSQGILIIDGLDELENESINSVLEMFYDFRRTRPDMRILISSRADLGFNITVDCDYRLSVPETSLSHDISEYIDDRIKTMTRQNGILTEDKQILEKMSVKLRERAKGMFLWVKLQLEALWLDCLADEAGAILAILDNLPDDLYSIYERCLQRIPPKLEKLALKTFSWIVCSLRPLTINECREVLALESDPNPWDGKTRIRKDVILSACTNLLSLDPEDQTVQFIHSSVVQYLFSEREKKPNSFALLNEGYCKQLCGIDCVKYLSFPEFDRAYNLQLTTSTTSLPSPGSITRAVTPSIVPRKMLALLSPTEKQAPFVHLPRPGMKADDYFKRAYVFYDYVQTYWLDHTTNLAADTSIASINSDLLKTIQDSFRNLAASPRLHMECYPWTIGAHGAPEYLQGLLAYAAANKHLPLLLLLVSELKDAELQRMLRSRLTAEGFTALHLAARQGFYHELLLTYSDVNAADKIGWTPLHHAASKGHVDFIQGLLDARDTKLNVLTNDSQSALGLAAASGSFETTSLLLSRGARHENPPLLRPRNEGPCLLHPIIVASKSGHTDILNLLLDNRDIRNRGRFVNSETQIGFGAPTFLLEAAAQAASCGRRGTFSLLASVEPTVSRLHECMQRWGVLYIAATHGHDQLVADILRRCDLDEGSHLQEYLTENLFRIIPKLVRSGYAGVLGELLKERSLRSVFKHEEGSGYRESSIHNEALVHDQVDVLKVVMQHLPIDVNSQNSFGNTMLADACLYDAVGCVDWLIHQPGIDITLLDKDAWAHYLTITGDVPSPVTELRSKLDLVLGRR